MNVNTIKVNKVFIICIVWNKYEFIVTWYSDDLCEEGNGSMGENERIERFDKKVENRNHHLKKKFFNRHIHIYVNIVY